MPTVNGQHFSYDAKGKAAAQKASAATGKPVQMKAQPVVNRPVADSPQAKSNQQYIAPKAAPSTLRPEPRGVPSAPKATAPARSYTLPTAAPTPKAAPSVVKPPALVREPTGTTSTPKSAAPPRSYTLPNAPAPKAAPAAPPAAAKQQLVSHLSRTGPAPKSKAKKR